jgi:hypothetical protein
MYLICGAVGAVGAVSVVRSASVLAKTPGKTFFSYCITLDRITNSVTMELQVPVWPTWR